MRPTKYRVWNLMGEWKMLRVNQLSWELCDDGIERLYFAADVEINNKHHGICSGFGSSDGNEADSVSACRLMQFTGYKDRENKEIWECDIVWKDICSKDDIVYGYYGDTYEVTFINGSWMMRNLDNGELVYLEEYYSIVKGIGNKYEDPDLLNN